MKLTSNFESMMYEVCMKYSKIILPNLPEKHRIVLVYVMSMYPNNKVTTFRKEMMLAAELKDSKSGNSSCSILLGGLCDDYYYKQLPLLNRGDKGTYHLHPDLVKACKCLLANEVLTIEYNLSVKANEQV